MDPNVQRLESLLALVTNEHSTAVLSQATAELSSQWLKRPETIPALLQIITQSQSTPVRQLAAVEARKLIEKHHGRAWLDLAEPIRADIKANILGVTVNESHNLVRHALARVISEIAKIEVAQQRWTELIGALHGLCTSSVASQREVGVYVLFTLFEVLDSQMSSFMPELLAVFSNSVNDPESLLVAVTTVQALGKLAEFIDDISSSFKTFRELVPSMVGALQRTIAAGDDDAAHKIFEVFEDLMVLELPFLQKHFADFVNLCAAIAKDTNQSDEVRSMALSFIMTSTHYARSKIQKQGLIPVILEAALPVAAEEEPADRDEQYPAKTALQLVNSLAVIFPPQHVFPLVMRNAVVFLQSADANYRRAAMLSIAVLVEGCADHMRERISEIFPLIVHAMQDAAPSVRRSACTALGALAEDLDDEVTVQHAVLLPLLLSMCDDPDPDVQPVAITTIDSIVESLDDEVAPYTDTLIQKLVGLLASPNRKTVLSATNCIGTLARSAGSAFGPYFEGVMARLYALMSLSETSDLDLRAVATDAVAAVAEAMGKEAFAPYTQRVMEVAIQGIHIDNSQLREYSYSFFGTLARVFGEDFSPFLSLIVPQIMFSCKLQDKDWNSLLDTTTPDEVDLDDEDDDEDDDANKFSFNSAISHEKASSFSALGELFAATRSAFMPYVADVLNAANGATQHFNEEVRISAAQCLLRFFTTVFSMAHPGEWTPGLPLAVPAHENVVSVAQLALGGVITMLEEEDSRMVMARLLQELTETIKQVGPAAVAFEFTDSPHESPRHLDALTGLLQLLFTGEHGCQISEDFDPSAGQGDEELAELDALVISTAADVLGALAAALGPNFPHVFAPFLPLIAKHYQKSRPVSDRSMAVGSLAEIVDGLESGISQFTGDLLQLFMRALRDDEEEVRSNAVFGLGVLIQYSTVDLTSYYPQLLQLLHPFFKSTAKSNLADNACGTVARMILRAPGAVPLDQVLPVFVEALPLKRDFVENESVIKCLLGLLDAQNAAAVALLPRIVHVFGQMLAPPAAQLRDADRSSLVGFMNSMRTHRAAEFEAIVAAMPADARDAVVRALTQ